LMHLLQTISDLFITSSFRFEKSVKAIGSRSYAPAWERSSAGTCLKLAA